MVICHLVNGLNNLKRNKIKELIEEMENKTIIITDKNYQITLLKEQYAEKTFKNEKEMQIAFNEMREKVNKLLYNK